MPNQLGPFEPRFTITPLMLRQMMAIARTRGCLEAVRTRPEWIEQLRSEVRVKDVLSSVQIEGNTLTREQAFTLARGDPPAELRDSEREFLNYLHAFDSIEMLGGERDYPVQAHDLRSLHGQLVQGVRGGDRFAGQFRREDVKIGDRQGDVEIIHHHPPPWHEVEEHIQHLLKWLRRVTHKPRREQVMAGKPDPWIHPVMVAGIAQHRLVWIHPSWTATGGPHGSSPPCCCTCAGMTSSTCSTCPATTTTTAMRTTRPYGPWTRAATTPNGCTTSWGDSPSRCSTSGDRRSSVPKEDSPAETASRPKTRRLPATWRRT